MMPTDKISESDATLFIERIDSGLTNESPFGSTLTTPVDEDVDLFSEMKTRLLQRERVVVPDSDGQELVPFDGDEIGLKIAEKNIPLLYSGEIKTAVIAPPASHHTGLDTEVLDREPRSDKLGVKLELLSEADQYALGLEHELGEFHDVYADDGNWASSASETSDITNETLLLLSELPFSPGHLPSQVFAEEADLDPLSLAFPTVTVRTLLLGTFRLISFVPWCALVGGTILLFPRHLEFVVFRSGYVRPPPSGIRRFQHWTDTGMYFVGIFLGLMFSLWWIIPRFGLVVGVGVSTWTAYTWGKLAFRGTKVVKLGQDDQESLWLTWMLHNGHSLKIREGRRGRYFASLV